MTKKASTKDRRSFISSVLMWTSVGVAYGLGAFHFLRYLVPLDAKIDYRELFVGSLDQLEIGQSRTIRSPDGDSYVMARIGEREFRVLSDVCPHLGCRVHWEADNDRFYCPCHAGVFDATGKATGGPPAEANQDLARLETVIRGNSVFVMIKES